MRMRRLIFLATLAVVTLVALVLGVASATVYVVYGDDLSTTMGRLQNALGVWATLGAGLAAIGGIIAGICASEGW